MEMTANELSSSTLIISLRTDARVARIVCIVYVRAFEVMNGE
jgi:hypothetical protein